MRHWLPCAAWASKPNLFQAKLIDTRIATLSLLFGDQKKVNWLNLLDGAVDVEWDAKHEHNTWTFGSPQTKGEPFRMPLIERAMIDGTTVCYRDPQMKLSTDISVAAIKASDNRVGRSIRFTGTGTMRGYPLTLTGGLTAPNGAAQRAVRQAPVQPKPEARNAEYGGQRCEVVGDGVEIRQHHGSGEEIGRLT